MADLQRTVEIIFGAIDNTGGGLSSVASGLDTTINKVSGVTEPLADLAKKALVAEGAVIALGAAFLTVAVNEASRFGEKVEEIGSLVNATPADVDKLKASIQDFAVNSVSNFDQINQAIYIATSNLGSTSKALDILTVAEQGSQVGATGLEASTALLTRTMNAYGLVSSDSATNTANAERVMAAMFTTVQNGDITMTALADNLGKVSSTAAAANIPIETVGAAIAAITGAGVGADQSMTLLNAVIKELLSPSDDLAKALGGLSVTTNGLPAVMDKLKEATGGSADKMYGLFSSSEAAKGALILANDSAGKFDGTLSAMSTSVQDFNRNYTNMVGGVADSSQQLANSTQVLLQKVGEPLQDSWAGILDGLKSVMQGFSLSIDKGAFEPVFTAFNGFGDDIAALLRQIGQNLPEALSQVDFSGLISALQDLGFELGDIFSGVDLSTPEGLANAIQFVVDSFESLTRVVSGIVDVWGPVLQSFLEGIDAFNGLDDSSRRTAGTLLGISQVFETLKSTLTSGAGALETIGGALQAIAGIQTAQTFIALSGAISTASTAVVGVLGPFGVVVASLTAIGVSLATNISAWDDYKDRQATVADSSGHLVETQAAIKDRLQEISEKTGVAVSSMTDLNRAVDEGKLVFNEATGAYEAAGSGVRDYDAEVAAASKGGFDFAKMVNDVAAGLGVVGESASDVVAKFATLEEAETAMWAEFDKGNKTSISFSDGLYQVHSSQKTAAESSDKLAESTKNSAAAAKVGSKEWKTVQDVMLETQKQADDFTVAMTKLSNENFEVSVRAMVDLKVADIEADTARITSAYQTISDVVATLAPEVSSLWGTFSQSTSSFDKSDIKDAANRMENRLDRELQTQIDLNNAIIEKMRAQTFRLSSGEPLISIDAGTLAPELELVFDKILKYTQIKATEQGLSLLMGL